MKKVLSILLSAVMLGSTMLTASVTANAATVKSTKITKVTAKSYSRVKITWKKIGKAKGYVLYRKKSGSSWKKIKKFKSNKTTSYYDNNLKSKTKYTYKIKTYNKVKGKTKYSKYSNSKSVTTPRAKDNIANLRILDSSYGSFYTINGVKTDTYGNKYASGFYSYSGYGKLYLNEKYSKLTLTMAVDEDARSDYEAGVEIYCDDNLIYEGTFNKMSKPVTITRNIKNGDILTIKVSENHYGPMLFKGTVSE